jgi:signal transduction histidine kinase
MATSLLDLSKLEAGKMNLTRSVTDLSALAGKVVKDLRIVQPARNITLDATGDTSCTCDAELTRRVLENLANNAAKHTPVAGRVRVIVIGLAEKVRVDVSDEGSGVPREKRPFIFDAFSAEGLLSTTGYESSGLGLAFSKLAIEVQGGTITVGDDESGGAVFSFELPR